MADEENVTMEAEVTEAEEEVDEKLEQSLPFPNATVVRLMKRNIEGNRMIKKQVKIGMNKFLGEIVEDVSTKMNSYPYTTMDYRMFQEASSPYRKVKELDAEVTRLQTHLDAIIQDCLSIKRDLDNKFGAPKD